MGWVRIDSEVQQSTEFLAIRYATRRHNAELLGCLSLIWLHVDEAGCMERGEGKNPFKDSDAVISDCDADLLAFIVGEDYRDVIAAMIDVGWIVEADKSLVFPNFGRRAPKGLRRNREDWAKRNAAKRHTASASRSASRSAIGTAKTTQTTQTYIPIAGAMGVESDDPTPTAQIIGYWNEVFGQKARSTPKRKTAIKARWKDEHFRANWADAMRRVSQSAFCMGQNDRNWVATIDWFLRPDSVTKILEGTYDDRLNGKSASKAQKRNRDQVAAFAEFLSDDDETGVHRANGSTHHVEAACGADSGPDASLVRGHDALRIEDRSQSDLDDDLSF